MSTQENPQRPEARQVAPGTSTLTRGITVDGHAAASSVADQVHEEAINKELRRLNRSLRVLSACNHAMARATSEQELLQQICDIIVLAGGYRMAGIAYVQHDAEKSMRPVAHAGHDSGYLGSISLKWSDTPEGQGPAGTAIRENRICLISDIANDPRLVPWREAALKRGFAAAICLPLRDGVDPFGILGVYSENAGAFETAEVDLLTEVSNNLAYGITALRARDESISRCFCTARSRGALSPTG